MRPLPPPLRHVQCGHTSLIFQEHARTVKQQASHHLEVAVRCSEEERRPRTPRDLTADTNKLRRCIHVGACLQQLRDGLIVPRLCSEVQGRRSRRQPALDSSAMVQERLHDLSAAACARHVQCHRAHRVSCVHVRTLAEGGLDPVDITELDRHEQAALRRACRTTAS